MPNQLTYKSSQQEINIEELVRKYAPLVCRIVNKIKNKCSPTVEFNDLVQYGVIGLLQAQQSFSKNKGATFKTYAYLKIQYAVYEGLRTQTGVTRDVSQYIKKISAATEAVEQQHGASSNQSIINEMDISHGQYDKMHQVINAYSTLSLEEIEKSGAIPPNKDNPPFSITLFNQFKASLKKAIQALPEREQLVLSLYYNEYFNFKEIGEILKISEARVSQIHHRILNQLRPALQPWKDAMEE